MFTNSKHQKAEEVLKKGQIDEAILLYTEALNEAPDDCNILSDRAVAFLHKGDKLRSMADFNKAVTLDPNYSYRYASRAYAKQHFGDTNGAVEDYQKAVELDPEDSVAHNNLGMLLEQQGYKKEAQQRFERADKLSKMEDQLYEVMDDLESDNQKEEIKANPNMTLPENNAAIVEPDQTENSDKVQADSSTGSELKKVFTSRAQFKEFMRFIRNGFKIK